MNRIIISRLNVIRIKRLYSTRKPVNVSDAAYCAGSVKRFDYENFLCSLLVSSGSRRDVLAIRAFNVELAKIPSLVSEHKIALMRLQFWEDSVMKLFDKKNPNLPQHPVVNELSLSLKKRNLTKRYFDRLINARKIQNLSFISTKEMEKYSEDSVSNVHYLVLEMLNCRNVNADHAASHLGKAQGITNILRSIHGQQSRTQYLPIPQEILMKHGVSQERVMRSIPNDKGVKDVVFEIATLAHQHLEKSLALIPSVPKESKIAFLPSVSCSRYLERLRKADFNLVDKNIGMRDNLLPLAIYWNKIRNF